MSVPNHIVKTFERLSITSTFVEFQSELLACVQNDGNVEEFLKEFHSRETNAQRVDFLHEKLQQYNLLADKFTEDAKSDKKAERHKRKGDAAFTGNKFARALQQYTKCIMKAQSGEVLAKGYANRSAALFKLEMYRECLVDIERALSHDYPDHQKPSLIARQKVATNLTPAATPLSDYYEPWPEIPDDQKNPAIPCASDSVEIAIDIKNRRRVFASKDIEVGDVIAVESPLSFLVAVTELYHCHECFELCYNPIPCKSCCQVVYCSEKCRDGALKTYHQQECAILASLKNIVGKHKAFLLAIKTSFLMENDPSASELDKLIDKTSGRNITDELFTISLVTALMYHLVKNHTQKFATNQDEDAENNFKNFVMTNLRICLNHAAGIDELGPSVTKDAQKDDKGLMQFKSETVGCGLYPFYSLFRHACCPNVIAHHHGTKRVLRAIRTVRQGQECFVSYGPYYIEHSKQERQRRLSSQYHFTCTCTACEENWPQLDLLPYYVHSPEDIPVVQSLRNSSDAVTGVALDTFIDKVKSFQSLEPSSDLTLYQKLLSYCYDIQGNKRRIP